MSQTYMIYLFGGVTLLGGLVVVTRKNTRTAALALCGMLLAVGAICFVLYAPLAGAAIMLLGAGASVAALLTAGAPGVSSHRRGMAWSTLIVVVALGWWLAPVLSFMRSQIPARSANLSAANNLTDLSPFFYALYLVPLELLAATLVVVILAFATATTGEDQYSQPEILTGPNDSSEVAR